MKTRNAYLALISGWYARLFDRPLQRLAARAIFSARAGLGLYMTTRHVVRATNYSCSMLAPYRMLNTSRFDMRIFVDFPWPALHTFLNFLD